MIRLLCFVLAVLTSPLKSKIRLSAENAALRHQLIVLRRKLHGRVHSQTAIAGSLYSYITGFHQSQRSSRSSVPRPLCVGIGLVFAAIGVGSRRNGLVYNALFWVSVPATSLTDDRRRNHCPARHRDRESSSSRRLHGDLARLADRPDHENWRFIPVSLVVGLQRLRPAVARRRQRERHRSRRLHYQVHDRMGADTCLPDG